ncbi:MAG: fatty acid--CoA ligase family protein, partial [Deltaproteobacteria bacterium]|nr:fatty acid--CoA ligase family protein [Deltaproteobacteria bacterium]
DFDPTSVGIPIPGVEWKILDDDRKPVSEGARGNLWVKGPVVFDRYWNDTERTSQARDGEWYEMGDVVEAREGRLYFHYRKGAGIRSGGEFVSPTVVEEALMKHPAVAEAYVVGVDDDEWGQKVSVVLVLKEGASATAAEVHTWMKGQVPKASVPKTFVFVTANQVPRTPAGKPILAELRRMVQSSGIDYRSSGEAGAANTTAAAEAREELLPGAAVSSEVVGVEQVRAEDTPKGGKPAGEIGPGKGTPKLP